MSNTMSNLVNFFIIFFVLSAIYCDQELTITVDPGAEQCFYEQLSAGSAFELDYQVIDGGQGELDISFYLSGPDNRPLLKDYKRPENSHRVEVQYGGAHRFCFDNRFSSFNRKTVFFALFSALDDDNSLEGIDTATEEEYEITVAQIEDAVNRVKSHLSHVRHMQEQVRAWEARDRNVAESNFARVNNWSMLQIGVMIAVGFVQVIMVKSLFDDQSRLNKFLRSSKPF